MDVSHWRPSFVNKKLMKNHKLGCNYSSKNHKKTKVVVNLNFRKKLFKIETASPRIDI